MLRCSRWDRRQGIFFSSTYASANYTLRWATYSVRFNKNNDAATGTMSDQNFTYGTAQALTANAFTRTGYIFAGWSTTPNGSVAYTDGQEVLNLTAEDGAIIDLYAQWTYSWAYVNALLATDGAVVTLHPNPDLPGSGPKTRRASLSSFLVPKVRTSFRLRVPRP